MTPDTLDAIKNHAAEAMPREACGLVVVRKGKERYVPCRNLAVGADHFHLHHEDYAAAEEAGDVLMIVHSHPNASPRPSQADLVACESSGLPWVIIAWPTGELCEFQPSGYKAPLVGRVFSHGVLDCYSIIRDYYREELAIDIPDFERPDRWWHGDLDLYRDNFRLAGFEIVEDLKIHDVILMQLASPKTNHGAVYLGDDVILHHPMNRLSGREGYGGFWKKITTCIVRHEALR